MLAKLRSHLTYANVVSSICLFIVLGGTSYAVATGSIDSREIKNNTVRSKDIRNNDVRGTDVRNGTIRGSDVGNNGLTGSDIAESTLGLIPNATHANRSDSASHANRSDSASHADSSGSAGRADSAGSVDSFHVLPGVTAAPGETKAVATDGPLTLQMRCIDNGSGNIGVVLEMDSSANSAAINASFSGTDADVLNANDPPANIAGDSGTSQAITQAGWAALTPSGGLFQGYGMVASKFGGGNNCMAKLVLIG
jgi:hypothetical protein